MPTLIFHGDDDRIVPIAASALFSAKIVKNATLKAIKGAPHGLCTTHKTLVNEELITSSRGNEAQRYHPDSFITRKQGGHNEYRRG